MANFSHVKEFVDRQGNDMEFTFDKNKRKYIDEWTVLGDEGCPVSSNYIFCSRLQCKCNANATQMQRKCNENATQMQCKCNAIATQMQRNCNPNATQMQRNCNANATQIPILHGVRTNTLLLSCRNSYL